MSFTFNALKWVSRATVACVWALSGCGGGGGGGGDGNGSLSAPYFPLAVGDRWLYGDVMVSASGTRVVAGANATVMQARDGNGVLLDEWLYVKTADGVSQLVSDNAPPLTRAIGPVQFLRFPLAQGQPFTQIDKTVDAGQDFDGDGRTETVSIKAVVTMQGVEHVTTPAGAFDGCAHLRTVTTQSVRYTSDGQTVAFITVADDWLAPDVGPVKSTSTTTSDGRIVGSSVGAIDGYAVGGRRSDTTSPAVVAVTPADGGFGNAGTVLSVTFTEAMDATTLHTSSLVVRDTQGHAMPGTVQWQDGQAQYRPVAQWAAGDYTATLSTSATDRLGNPIEQPWQWRFSIDVAGPTVLSVSPATGTNDVDIGTAVTVVFSEPVDPRYLANGVLVLGSPQGPVDAQVRVDGATVTITPTAPLQPATPYTVTVAGIVDLAGNGMQTNYSSTFRTDAGRFAFPVALINVGSPIDAVAIGDVNGDGRPDVLLGTGYYFDPPNDFKLFVRLQQADGTLAPAIKYDTGIAYGAWATSINVIDIDGDGRNDVVIGEGGGGIEVFLQNPAGGLASAYRLPGDALNLRVADLNNDGRPDLVALTWGSGTVQVWWQQAGGGFTTPTSYAVEHAGWEDMELGDVNGDGRIDIVITSGQGDAAKALAVLPQLPGGGGFGTPIYRQVDTTWGSWGVAVGDINGDGRNDIVASHDGNSPTFISVFRQGADGSLPLGDKVSTYDIPAAVEIADMDGDGRRDVVVAHNGWLAVSLYRQQADGTLGAEERFPAIYADTKPHALALGDVNGDGLRDIVIGNTVLLQKAAARPAGASTRVMRAGATWRVLSGWPGAR